MVGDCTGEGGRGFVLTVGKPSGGRSKSKSLHIL